jgi:hypothetical protein
VRGRGWPGERRNKWEVGDGAGGRTRRRDVREKAENASGGGGLGTRGPRVRARARASPGWRSVRAAQAREREMGGWAVPRGEKEKGGPVKGLNLFR